MRSRAALLLGSLLLAAATLTAEEPPAPPPPPPPAKAQPPADAALTPARKMMRDIYRTEYAKPVPADRLALARKLIADSTNVRGEPVARFVLLDEARVLAAGAGDAAIVFSAIESLGNFYDVDEWALKVEALTAVSRADLAPPEAESAVRLGLAVLGELVQREDFAAARNLVPALFDLARRARSEELIHEVQEQQRAIAAQQLEFDLVKPALAAMKKSPDDAAACLLVGKYYALLRGDWAKGLPLLAKSSDADLKSAAAKELVPPGDATAQLALADAWRAEAPKAEGAARLHVQRHAIEWYEHAIPGLQGLQKMVAEKRRNDLEAALSGSAALPAPVVEVWFLSRDGTGLHDSRGKPVVPSGDTTWVTEEQFTQRPKVLHFTRGFVAWPDEPAFHLAEGTLTAWVYYEGGSVGVGGKGVPGGADEYSLLIWGGKLATSTNYPRERLFNTPTSVSVPAKQWSFVAIGWGAKECTYWLDGKQVAKTKLAMPHQFGAGRLEVGVNSPGGAEYFKGKIAHFALYKGCLADAAVRDLYKAEARRLGLPVKP